MTLKSNINDRELDKFEEVAGETTVRTTSLTYPYPLNQRRDEISSLLYYVGDAKNLAGSASDPIWRIYRYSKVGTAVNTEYALSGTFTGVWDDRYSYFTTAPFANPFSVNFTGANDYVNIGNVSELSFAGTSPFSISSWSKGTSTASRAIFSKQGSSSSSGYRFYTQANTSRILISGGTAAADRIEVWTPNISVSNGSWHHCVVTYDGSGTASGVRFYHAGSLVAPGTYTIAADLLTGTVTNTTAAQISGRNATTENFLGALNNISVWDKALSATEVTELYASTHPSDLSQHSAVANLVGWWVCYDEADVPVFPNFTDRSASLNHGTGISMTLTQINIDVP